MDVSEAYQVLGVTKGARPEVVRQAYRRMAKLSHPDRFAGDPKRQAAAQHDMKRINAAYQLAKNEARKERPSRSAPDSHGASSAKQPSSQSTRASNRRRAPRVPFERRASYKFRSRRVLDSIEYEIDEGIIRNISSAGMFMHVAASLPPNFVMLKVQFSLPGEPRDLDVWARVAWRRGDVVGLQFSNPRAVDLAAIERFVSNCSMEIPCPACPTRLRTHVRDFDRTVRCRRCGHRFVPQQRVA